MRSRSRRGLSMTRTMLLDPDKTTSLTIESWPDPVIDSLGRDSRTHDVESYWLPVLGPPSITIDQQH